MTSLLTVFIDFRIESDLCLCARRLLSSVILDQARQQAHSNSRQCRLVQYHDRFAHGVPHLWWARRRGCTVLYCRYRCLLLFHDPDLHPRVLRREPFQTGAVAPGPLQYSHRRRGVQLCGAHGADFDVAQHDPTGSQVSGLRTTMWPSS